MTNLFKKAMVFTDLHVGAKGNSTVHNDDCLSFVEWATETGIANGCETAIFLGDWNNSRANISILTLHYSIKAIEHLSKNFKDVYVIVGNHDQYRKDNRDVHSIEWAQHLSNVHLINEFITDGDVTFVPWLVGEDYKQIPKIKSTYTFGHFELPHFMMNAKVMMPDHGELKREDFKNTGTMFSGHFHKRQSYKNIHYIGNAFPHNFSDEGDDDRGIMILEWGKDPVYHSWPDQPTFRVYNLSDIIDKSDDYLKKNMHVRLTLDMDIKYEDCMDLKTQLVDTYSLRELSLIQMKKNILDDDQTIEIGKFETVNDIVTRQITNITSEHFDPAILLSIYRSL